MQTEHVDNMRPRNMYYILILRLSAAVARRSPQASQSPCATPPLLRLERAATSQSMRDRWSSKTNCSLHQVAQSHLNMCICTSFPFQVASRQNTGSFTVSGTVLSYVYADRSHVRRRSVHLFPSKQKRNESRVSYVVGCFKKPPELSKLNQSS